jgi:integrase/recombinase XerD
VSPLRQAALDYVTVRRALGAKLEDHPRLLESFVAYVETAGATTITTELALAWATLPGPDAHPAYLSNRLCVVRGFARHVQAFDPATQVPPVGLLPRPTCRAVPYLYSDADIAALMAAARCLTPALRAATYTTLIALLSATGMRVAEALRLRRDDIDWTEGVVTIRDTKFGKHREVPLDDSSLEGLSAYRHQRDELCPCPATQTFFVSQGGTALVYTAVLPTFARIVRDAGLRPRSPRCRPRVHDMRHTFGLHRPHRLVSGRRRRRSPPAGVVHLLGAYAPLVDVLVLVGGP